MDVTSLHSRHIVVTGVSRGIGRALTDCLAGRGAKLTVCARDQESMTILDAHPNILGRALSINQRAAVQSWIADGVAASGPIDVLINNVGMLGPMMPMDDYPPDQWQQVLETNLMGTFHVVQAALPHVVRPGGIMLHVSSYLGRHGLENYGAYCVSKFGIEGMAQILAEEHRHEGIISCAIDPGMVQTEMLRAAMGTDDVSEHHTPEQAADAFIHILQDLTLEDSGRPINLWNESPASAE